jgi:hypothetical protein
LRIEEDIVEGLKQAVSNFREASKIGHSEVVDVREGN